MSTYSMTGAADFFIYLLEDEHEQRLWQIWLNKKTEHEDDFEKFKKASMKKKQIKRMSKAEEDNAINKAKSILNIKEKGGS